MVKENKETLMGLIMVAISMILFPIIIDGTETIMAWTGTGGNITQFTGLSSIVPIAPMMIFVFLIFGGLGLSGYGAIKTAQSGKIGMALLMSLIMLAIAFVVYPIVMDGAATIINDPNIDSYTGLAAIAKIAPMLVFVMMLFESLGTGAYAGYKAIKGKE